MSIRTNLDKIAANIAARVTPDATESAANNLSFAETLDAFKALTAYYALLLKNKDGSEDADEPSGFDFESGIAPENSNGRAVPRRAGT